jgi:hypothetical protein
MIYLKTTTKISLLIALAMFMGTLLAIHENELLLIAEASKQKGLKVIITFIKGYGYYLNHYYIVSVGTGGCYDYEYTANERVSRIGQTDKIVYIFQKDAVPVYGSFYVAVTNTHTYEWVCEEGAM